VGTCQSRSQSGRHTAGGQLTFLLFCFGALSIQLDQAGADGLVLFNRLYLLWISLLSERLPRASLAASTGVQTADEVIKYLLAGADAVITTSALLRNGPGHLRSLLFGLESWLRARNFDSVTAIKGLMRPPLGAKAEARERDNYVQGLLSYRGPHLRR
jgi:dihydroorotate dehydrogenase (fumarate)